MVSPQLHRYSLLVMDDEEMFVETVVQKYDWKSMGIHWVKGVYSAGEAKSYLKDNPVNLMLCDIEMPGESGLSFVEWILEYSRFSKDPIQCIMLTCHPEYAFMRKAMQLGCQDYLLKPVLWEELEASIAKAVHTLDEYFLNQSEGSAIEPEGIQGKEIIGQKCLPYIEENLSKPFTVKDLADSVCLSPQYLMRLFKKVVGFSVLDYVTQRKMEKAKELLLSTNLSIDQISEKLGYCTYSYFSKLFKRETGLSPLQYRKQYGK